MSSYATTLWNHECQNVAMPSVLSTTLLVEHIVDILSILPVESLIRFHCVSKSWYTLLSSSHFIKYHIQRSNTGFILNNHRLLCTGFYSTCFWLSLPLSSILNDQSPYPILLGHLLHGICNDPFIVGSCNGLICWIDYSESSNYICYSNPATKVKARSPYLRYPLGGDSSYNLFGFGYDHINDSYKTIVIFCDPEVHTIEKKTEVKVYELGALSAWRRIQSFPCVPMRPSYPDQPCGVFVNGTLNWLCTRPNDSLVVVSIDLVKDTCEEVLLPEFVDPNRNAVVARPNLWVLDGCLCFSHEQNETTFVLWQMKVYGDASSWNNLFKISYRDVGINREIPRYPKPLLMLSNGDVVLQISKYDAFICYKPMRNSYKYFSFPSGRTLFETTLHIDSLVSPYPTHHHLRIGGHSSHTKVAIGTSG